MIGIVVTAFLFSVVVVLSFMVALFIPLVTVCAIVFTVWFLLQVLKDDDDNEPSDRG